MKLSYKKIIVVTLVIAGIVFQYGCRKNENPYSHYYYLDQETKDYAYFKIGSQWIYLLENTGTRDTLTHSSQSGTTDKSGIADEGEPIFYESESYEQGIYYNYFLYYKSSYYQDSSFIFLTTEPELNSFLAVDGSDIVTIFFSNKPEGTTLWTYGSSTYEKYYAEYSQAGKTYKEVKVFTVNGSIVSARAAKRIFYAKNVGIIRKELFNGQVWNLESYDVAQ